MTELILSSTIQVAIAIAGFTGIVLAVSNRPSISARHKISLSILLVSSLACVLFAFIPMLLMSAGIDDADTWRWSSAIFVVYFIGILLYRRLEYKKAGVPIPKLIQFLIGVFTIAAILQIPNVFYLKQAWPYLILLVSYIVYSFSIFAFLLWDLWLKDDDD